MNEYLEKITDKEQLIKYNNKYVVYMIVFPNNKKYCGYSSNIKQRWRSPNEYRTQKIISNAIKHYGWDNLDKYIYKSFDNAKEALQEEAKVTKELQLTNIEYGYNTVEGGGDPPHGSQYITEEGREAMRKNGKRLANEIWGNPEKAEYCKRRMKEEDHKSRMMLSEEERKVIWGSHNIGRTPPNAKPVYQIDLKTGEIIKEFPSTKAAERELELPNRAASNIRRTAGGIGKSAYGFGWRYKNEDDVD